MFYYLNRLRGTHSYFAKINAVILGAIFSVASQDIYIGLAVAVGYLAGESMGWGEWIGGLIRHSNNIPIPENPRRDGGYNGIQWITTKFTSIDSPQYHALSLGIRGFYWWILAFSPLLFIMSPPAVLLGVIALSLGFPLSVLAASNEGDQWENAEYIYGWMQDLVIGLLVVQILLQ